MRLLLALMSTVAATAASPTPASAEFTSEGAKDGWIVVLKEDAPDHAFLHMHDMAVAAGSAPRHVIDFGSGSGSGSLRGYVMSGPGSEIAVHHLANSPYVDFIQPDTKFSVDDVPIDAALHANENDDYKVSNPTKSWGLHRVSHGPLQPGEPLEYPHNSTGRNAWVYVVDSGIQLDHPQFGGRAIWGRTYVYGRDEFWRPEGGDDYGHGTHCAGIIGGSSLGVAQETNLVAVKVLDNYGYGKPSDAVRGLLWVIEDATKHDRLEKSVVSMSFGTYIPRELLRQGKPDALQLASQIASKSGMFMVAAAGNDHLPVNTTSPAAGLGVCTVGGAMDRNDTLASWANYGTEVDLVAPGTDVLSAYPGNTTREVSGTSQAAPFVAGLGAYFIELDGPGKYPGYKMCERLKAIGSYQKGVEGLEAPANFTDTHNKYTRVASNGWGR